MVIITERFLILFDLDIYLAGLCCDSADLVLSVGGIGAGAGAGAGCRSWGWRVVIDVVTGAAVVWARGDDLGRVWPLADVWVAGAGPGHVAHAREVLREPCMWGTGGVMEAGGWVLMDGVSRVQSSITSRWVLGEVGSDKPFWDFFLKMRLILSCFSLA